MGARGRVDRYDALSRWLLGGDALVMRLVSQAGIEGGHRVLDLGCGTGRLALAVKDAVPDAEVCGVDPDAEFLEGARAKLAAAGLEVSLQAGRAEALPFPDASFDRVVSALVFHHLDPKQKREALQEVMRVLRPGGELHFADFGRATNFLMRLLFLPIQLTDGFATTSENAAGVFPGLLTAKGFAEARMVASWSTMLGTVGFYAGRRP